MQSLFLIVLVLFNGFISASSVINQPTLQNNIKAFNYSQPQNQLGDVDLIGLPDQLNSVELREYTNSLLESIDAKTEEIGQIIKRFIDSINQQELKAITSSKRLINDPDRMQQRESLVSLQTKLELFKDMKKFYRHSPNRYNDTILAHPVPQTERKQYWVTISQQSASQPESPMMAFKHARSIRSLLQAGVLDPATCDLITKYETELTKLLSEAGLKRNVSDWVDKIIESVTQLTAMGDFQTLKPFLDYYKLDAVEDRIIAQWLDPITNLQELTILEANDDAKKALDVLLTFQNLRCLLANECLEDQEEQPGWSYELVTEIMRWFQVDLNEFASKSVEDLATSVSFTIRSICSGGNHDFETLLEGLPKDKVTKSNTTDKPECQPVKSLVAPTSALQKKFYTPSYLFKEVLAGATKEKADVACTFHKLITYISFQIIDYVEKKFYEVNNPPQDIVLLRSLNITTYYATKLQYLIGTVKADLEYKAPETLFKINVLGQNLLNLISYIQTSPHSFDLYLALKAEHENALNLLAAIGISNRMGPYLFLLNSVRDSSDQIKTVIKNRESDAVSRLNNTMTALQTQLYVYNLMTIPFFEIPNDPTDQVRFRKDEGNHERLLLLPRTSDDISNVVEYLKAHPIPGSTILPSYNDLKLSGSPPPYHGTPPPAYESSRHPSSTPTHPTDDEQPPAYH
ncbi:hypothetical protein NEHOM01_2277 [Nematocida homosporus]|uniref:uncharacterized protein n=1 Tax=Nematocida homosporus TaxID=1912981 RepID=UPI00221E6CB6|nr:uncharacterized protein NEHOM01_2277 [Nematocida homosporus]KAI5187569.1 hypothetical protein NEHOM01_2277 [Nematocida homosporus]